MVRPLCLIARAALALSLAGCCRLHSTYDSRVTALCRDEGMVDAGTPTQARDRCEACCRRHGLSGVEPGYCECGEMGLDGLMK